MKFFPSLSIYSSHLQSGFEGERLDLVSHMSIYSVFHRTASNRAVHAVFSPLVVITGFFLLAVWSVPLAAMVIFTLGVSLAWVSVWGSLLTFAALIPVCVVTLDFLPMGWTATAVALFFHLLGWAMLVVVGHQWMEPKMWIGGVEEDSNLYFRRGYYVGKNLGRDLHWLDRVAQFNIGPMVSTMDVLFAMGLLGSLRCKVDERVEQLQSRLELGIPPFAVPFRS